MVLALALLTVAIGWPLSNHVSELRLERFSTDEATASAARAAFGPWHLASLALSVVRGIPLFVSNGLGQSGVPFRFLAPPQVALFVLRAKLDEGKPADDPERYFQLA